MSIQIIVTGAKQGYYSKFKSRYRPCFIFPITQHTGSGYKKEISQSFRWSLIRYKSKCTHVF